mgnify:FL=1
MPGFVINHWLLLKEQGNTANIIDPHDYGIDSYAFVIFTTDGFIKKDPKVVKDFVNATLYGYAWAIENKEKATRLAMSFNPVLKESNYGHELNQLVVGEKYFLPTSASKLGCMQDNVWKQSYERLKEQGLLEKEFDYRDAFTTKFVAC